MIRVLPQWGQVISLMWLSFEVNEGKRQCACIVGLPG